MKTWDVIIIGGGIIGLSLAIAVRKRGATVLVVERGEPGREASHAAGGMLVDCPLETQPALQPLATASAHMYPEFAYELKLESGMKVDLRDQGTILFLSAEDLHQAEASGFLPASLTELEPALVVNHSKGLPFYRPERSVDPRALTAAAWKTAKHRSVDFSSGDEVIAVTITDGRATGVKTTKTAFHAAKVVNCAGAWSGQIPPHGFPTRPVKGQMLCLLMPSPPLLKHVVRSPEVYLIPRSDGRLLVGATAPPWPWFRTCATPKSSKTGPACAPELPTHSPSLARPKLPAITSPPATSVMASYSHRLRRKSWRRSSKAELRNTTCNRSRPYGFSAGKS